LRLLQPASDGIFSVPEKRLTRGAGRTRTQADWKDKYNSFDQQFDVLSFVRVIEFKIKCIAKSFN
jgi:hypothetical protein